MSKSAIQIHPRAARPLWLLLILGAMLLVAACAPGGTSNTTTNTAAQASPTATAAPTGTPTADAKTGCPAATQKVTWSPKPGAVFTAKPSSTINVKVGETFEIVVPMGHTWRMAPLSGSVLKLDAPAGYGDAATQNCVWHFTTLASGQTTLNYTMRAICKPGAECPNYILEVDLTVKASA